jgi:tetratricopeptide (TPR) repeat protein
LPRVLARRVAYSHKALADNSPYLQARAVLFASRYIYWRALTIQEQLLGSDHPDVALTCNNLAVLYRAQGRYGDAAAFYQRTLAIFAQVHGPTHPSVVACRENYAQLLQAMQREG